MKGKRVGIWRGELRHRLAPPIPDEGLVAGGKLRHDVGIPLVGLHAVQAGHRVTFALGEVVFLADDREILTGVEFDHGGVERAALEVVAQLCPREDGAVVGDLGRVAGAGEIGLPRPLADPFSIRQSHALDRRGPLVAGLRFLEFLLAADEPDAGLRVGKLDRAALQFRLHLASLRHWLRAGGELPSGGLVGGERGHKGERRLLHALAIGPVFDVAHLHGHALARGIGEGDALRSDGTGGKLKGVVDPVGAPGQAEGLLDGERPRFSRKGRALRHREGQKTGHEQAATVQRTQPSLTGNNHGGNLRMSRVL